MTHSDHDLDLLLRPRVTDAEVAGLDLPAGRDALLADVLAERRRPGVVRLVPRPAVAALAAAGVAATLVVGTALLPEPAGSPDVGGTAAGSPGTVASATTPPDGAGSAVGSDTYRDGDWVVVDVAATGWQVEDADEDATSHQVAWRLPDGGTVEATVRPTDAHAGYRQDRLELGEPEPTRLLGVPAELFTYAADDHTVMTAPVGGSFVEVRVSGVAADDLAEVLPLLRSVPESEVDAALAGVLLAPADQDELVLDMLDVVPLPAGTTAAEVADEAAATTRATSYAVGAEVVYQLACRWVDDYERTGSPDAAAAGLGAAAASPFVADLDRQGDVGGLLRGLVVDLADGRTALQLRESLGDACA